jgi:hypothetical protein
MRTLVVAIMLAGLALAIPAEESPADGKSLVLFDLFSPIFGSMMGTPGIGVECDLTAARHLSFPIDAGVAYIVSKQAWGLFAGAGLKFNLTDVAPQGFFLKPTVKVLALTGSEPVCTWVVSLLAGQTIVLEGGPAVSAEIGVAVSGLGVVMDVKFNVGFTL